MDYQNLTIVRPVPVKRWATEDGFTAHMGTIFRLYDTERKTLKQVMEYMKREHNFFATRPRMYKTRIKKWSFCKNNRANEALAILTAKRQRGAIQEPSEFLIHGRPLDVDRFERYVRRRPDLVMQAARQAAADDSPFPGHLLARAVLVRTPPPPLLSRSGDPADMREEFLLIFDEWIKGSQ